MNLAGPVKVISESCSSEMFKGIYQRPAEARKLFEERGWSTVAALQLRNPMHNSHAYLAWIAIEVCDGVSSSHQLVGKLKPGGTPAEVRVKAIDALVNKYFRRDRVIQGGYPMEMRYAGPREALLHAVFRQNYGCSHLKREPERRKTAAIPAFLSPSFPPCLALLREILRFVFAFAPAGDRSILPLLDTSGRGRENAGRDCTRDRHLRTGRQRKNGSVARPLSRQPRGKSPRRVALAGADVAGGRGRPPPLARRRDERLLAPGVLTFDQFAESILRAHARADPPAEPLPQTPRGRPVDRRGPRGRAIDALRPDRRDRRTRRSGLRFLRAS